MLNFEEFYASSDECRFEASNLTRKVFSGNGLWENLLLLGQMNQGREMSDAMGNRYAMETLLDFYFFNSPHLQAV